MERDGMNIRHPLPEEEPALRQLWADVFDDEPDFIDAFFRLLYAPERTAAAFIDGAAAAAAYVIPFGEARYIYAVGTHPAWRGRGLGQAVTMAAADGKPAYLSPANPSLRRWYQDRMGAEIASQRSLATPQGVLHQISAAEYRERRETLLAARLHASYSSELLQLFSQSGGFYAGEEGLFAIENGCVKESLPPIPGDEPYLLSINSAPPLYWGLVLD